MKFKATNFDLIDIKYEISILEQQLNTISKEYERHKKQSKKTTDKQIKKNDFNPNDQRDEAEYWILVDEHKHLVNDVLPRILINPFVVSLWSLYETAISDLSDLIKGKENVELSLYDINGAHFTAKAKKYFDHVLNFPFNITDQLLEDVKIIVNLRNGVAHGNSRLNSLKKSLVNDLRSGNINGVDISRMGDFFVLKPEFSKWSFGVLKSHLDDLMSEYESKYF